MKQSPQILARINTIAKELANGKERGYILGKYAKKWGLSRTSLDRYITSAKVIAKGMADLKDKTIKEAIVSETTEAVKRGLKSKFDRVMFYQDEIEKMEDQLNGKIKFTFTLGNSIKHSHTGETFMLPIQTQIALREQIKSYQTEISRIEGDYEKDNRQSASIIRVTRKLQ